MPDVTVKVMDNGPYVVTGTVEVVDAEGKRFELSFQGCSWVPSFRTVDIWCILIPVN